MDMDDYTRDDAMIERLLLGLGIDVPLEHVQSWHWWTAEEVERWCVAMAATHPTDGLAIQPIPDALSGYVMAYGPPARRRQHQS